MNQYPKRLIEVDLPIKRISAHARREKSIRHGHISTLHIWWARRPLAACRAVICASLWPDPADELCPSAFRDAARAEMHKWTENRRLKLLGNESQPHFDKYQKQSSLLNDNNEVRQALLDFIADFANWNNSTKPDFLETSRTLTQAAHEALGGIPDTRPLVVDPFAGGGSIPLEALRVGADAFASDLNPVAVLLNKMVLEYIPKYNQRLVNTVREWGQWIKKQAEKELSKFYPKDPDGATPIAYLWARTIICEGPGCGTTIPLVRSLWLAKKQRRQIVLQLKPDRVSKRIDFYIITKERDGWRDQDKLETKIDKPSFDGTVNRGSVTCPCCGYTTPVTHVREQLKSRKGGANDARLICVATLSSSEDGRRYRLATCKDYEAIQQCQYEVEQRVGQYLTGLTLIPTEPLDIRGIRHTWAMIYGFTEQRHFYTYRQLLALLTLTNLVNDVGAHLLQFGNELDFVAAVQTSLAFAVSKESDLTNSLCTWKPDAECPVHMMARQAIPMLWDFAEAVPISNSSGSWTSMIERTLYAIESTMLSSNGIAQASQGTATNHVLPAASADMYFTDPPYYDAVPYSYLSDFFYVWLRRCLIARDPALFGHPVVPKDEEIVVDRPHELSHSTHNIDYYEQELAKAFAEGRRLLQPTGIGLIVFASKTTASWEAILGAVIHAGWIITGSWPIDTEMETRVAAQGQARLASSVHLVCRPREITVESAMINVGDWRDVLRELPQRIHDWLPRLSSEGVVGADAIFACLGPALEIFSRYNHVEKASGEFVTFGEYLEQVWAAVSKEALAMVFQGADTTDFEEDARLTAMWLWTLSTVTDIEAGESSDKEEIDDEDEEHATNGKGTKNAGGYTLEYDAARKIAQGLGAHLEQLSHLIEIQGKNARLLPVDERVRYLFGQPGVRSERVRTQGPFQPSLFETPSDTKAKDWARNDYVPLQLGQTTLDRVHQSMMLFAAGHSEGIKRFLVTEGVGYDERFWRLAQALSALYPPKSNEKRWVDGVLARKKGLGFA